MGEIEENVRAIVEDMSLHPRKALLSLRVAVTGRTVSPPLFETIHLALEAARHILIEQHSHSDSRASLRISKAAMACSRRTEGKSSKNSSSVSPPSR